MLSPTLFLFIRQLPRALVPLVLSISYSFSFCSLVPSYREPFKFPLFYLSLWLFFYYPTTESLSLHLFIFRSLSFFFTRLQLLKALVPLVSTLARVIFSHSSPAAESLNTPRLISRSLLFFNSPTTETLNPPSFIPRSFSFFSLVPNCREPYGGSIGILSNDTVQL